MRKKPTKSKLVFGLARGEMEALQKAEAGASNWLDDVMISGGTALQKSVSNVDGEPIERLAFTQDPTENQRFHALYHNKLKLIPDTILKRIAIQDSLVATIVRIRQFHVSSFGRPRPSRFEQGYMFEPTTGLEDRMDAKEKEKFNQQRDRAIKLLSTCGHTTDVDDDHDRESFSRFLAVTARDAVVCGRVAFEVIHKGEGEARKFHCFRSVDAGTIYRATKNEEGNRTLRQEAYNLLCEVAGEKLVKESFAREDYEWVQVINQRPVQAFTADEMKVYNFYPVSNVELNGYPLTPIDTVITAISTHVNIATHNKLYFQSGRASRGMLVITSDDVNPQIVANIKQNFNNSINNVSNSWRMPVFGCATGETIDWKPIDMGSKDGEFQYLTDMNAREIMGAFGISPDELPGYQHLSRGGNSQTLSESNNEFKLEAARDVGIRPLLHSFEDMINAYILPLIDADLASKGKIRLMGLDEDNAEKEAVRLQQDAELHLTYDDLMRAVEKKPVGRAHCGEIPLNPVFKTYIDQYLTQGQIMEFFMGVEGAAKDPKLAFYNNPGWFQWYQLQNPPAPAPEPTAPPNSDNGGSPPSDDKDKDELGGAVDQAHQLMTKSEDLPANKRRLLDAHDRLVEYFIDGFTADSKELNREILNIAKHHTPRSDK